VTRYAVTKTVHKYLFSYMPTACNRDWTVELPNRLYSIEQTVLGRKEFRAWFHFWKQNGRWVIYQID